MYFLFHAQLKIRICYQFAWLMYIQNMSYKVNAIIKLTFSLKSSFGIFVQPLVTLANILVTLSNILVTLGIILVTLGNWS